MISWGRVLCAAIVLTFLAGAGVGAVLAFHVRRVIDEGMYDEDPP